MNRFVEFLAENHNFKDSIIYISGTKKADTSKAREGVTDGLLLEIAYQLSVAEGSQMEITYGEYKVPAEEGDISLNNASWEDRAEKTVFTTLWTIT